MTLCLAFITLHYISVYYKVIVCVSDFLLHAFGIPVQLGLPGLLLFGPEFLRFFMHFGEFVGVFRASFFRSHLYSMTYP